MAKRWMLAALLLLQAAACGKPHDPGPAGELGAMKTTLIESSPIPEVASVRVDVLQGLALAASQKIALGAIVPPGTTTPQTGGDAFFLLAPGAYHVDATALDAAGNASAACTRASADVAVTRGNTTEIVLALFCGEGSGGLDVVVIVDRGPQIKRFVINPSKFTTLCDQITLRVDAASSSNSALTYAWAVVAAPAGADYEFVPTDDAAIFRAKTVGDYAVSVTVSDKAGATTGLTVPLHVSDGPLCTGPAVGVLQTTIAEPVFVKGAQFPAFPPAVGEPNAEEEAPFIPVGLLRGDLSPSTGNSEAFFPNLRAPVGNAPVSIPLNTAFGTLVSFSGSPPDMSGASSGDVVLTTGNTWGAYSTNGGASFTAIDPTTIFPSGPSLDSQGRRLDGGICCDQVVQYVPSIDRFVWLMQFWGPTPGNLNGPNMIRIASASPAQLRDSGASAWTYWDLRTGTFGLGSSFLDYPDMSVGDNSLYISIDQVGTGLLVMRIPLAQIRDSQTIFIDYTNPPDSGSAYGGHLMQNTGNELFWAGQLNNSRMRIFSLREGDGRYYWRDVDINSWPNNGPSYKSLTPDGTTDWLNFLWANFPGGSVLGATRVQGRQDQLWFAWSAAAGGNFPQPHVQIVVLNHSNFSVAAQVQIWNPSVAFAYPYLASAADREVAMMLGIGGSGIEATSAFGYWGDFVVYPVASSVASQGRFGDYVTLRRDGGDPLGFAGIGYSISQGPNGGGQYYDPHFIKLARPPPP